MDPIIKLHSNITNGPYGNRSPLNVQALDMISLNEFMTVVLVDVSQTDVRRLTA